MVEDQHPYGSHRRCGRSSGVLFCSLQFQSAVVALPCADDGRRSRKCPHDTPTTYAVTGSYRISDRNHLCYIGNIKFIINIRRNETISKHYYGQYKRSACYGKACKWLNDNQIPFEVNALSAHRTPDAVESFAKGAKERGVKVIIAAAGMAAALPGVIAASTPLPVIGVPIKGMLDGLDAMLSIIQMPPGIPVATVGVNAAQNAAILAAEMIALADEEVAQKVEVWKAGLGAKIEKANKDLAEVKYDFKCN